ncbi:MAG: rhomboid family intramembrane serine protease [Ignavibacteriaceae bacterium]
MAFSDRDSYRPGGGYRGFSFFPPVIKNLLLINGVVFFLQTIMKGINFEGVPAENIIIHWFSLMPLGHGFEVWQLLSYQFMHGGFSHILFNMFALWMFGAEIENVWGSKKFLLFYLLCGVGAGLLHLFLSPVLSDILAPTIGASGAVYGIMIAFAMFFPDRYIYIYFFIPVKAKYLIGFMIILEFMLVDSAASNVAHLAHLGGALVGFLFIMFDKNTKISVKDSFQKVKRSFGNRKSSGGYFSGPTPTSSYRNPDIDDAKYHDVNNDREVVTQEEIDRILDKISKSGYKNLTEREKKILFEASKKM